MPSIVLPRSTYWKDRAEEAEIRANAMGVKTEAQVARLFKQTNKELAKEIESFYSTYGKTTKTPVFKTLPDGTKVISGYSDKVTVPFADANKQTAKGTRLQILQKKLGVLLKEHSGIQTSTVELGLIDIAEQAYNHSLYDIYHGLTVGKSVTVLPKSLIKQLIHTDVNGKDFSDRIWSNTIKLADNVNQTLRAGLAQGLTNQEMARRISDSMDSGMAVASRLVRTEVTNTLNQATLQSYRDTGLVEEYEFLATLDKRTSSICSDLDGDKFLIEDAVAGLNLPPMHPRCRSTTIPYFEDTPQQLTRIARDLEGDSIEVPADMTYAQFAAKYIN